MTRSKHSARQFAARQRQNSGTTETGPETPSASGRHSSAIGRRLRRLLGAVAVLAAVAAIVWLIRPPALLQGSGGELDPEAAQHGNATLDGDALDSGPTVESGGELPAPDASAQGGAEAPGPSSAERTETTTAVADDPDPSDAAGTLWQVVDESSVAELPAYKEVVEDRVLIRVTGAAAGWEAGQRITIPVPQLDEVYTPVIERVEPGPAGIRSFVGTLTDDGGLGYRFTITTGPRNTFANLSTPSGGFELVATGELGWLMPVANMDQHVDYSVPDYVIPDEPVFFER